MKKVKNNTLPIASASMALLTFGMLDSKGIETVCVISSFVNGMMFYEAFFMGERNEILDIATIGSTLSLIIPLYFISELDIHITISILFTITASTAWIFKK